MSLSIAYYIEFLVIQYSLGFYHSLGLIKQCFCASICHVFVCKNINQDLESGYIPIGWLITDITINGLESNSHFTNFSIFIDVNFFLRRRKSKTVINLFCLIQWLVIYWHIINRSIIDKGAAYIYTFFCQSRPALFWKLILGLRRIIIEEESIGHTSVSVFYNKFLYIRTLCYRNWGRDQLIATLFWY